MVRDSSFGSLLIHPEILDSLGKQMSSPKTAPLAQNESVIELHSIVLEEKPVSLTPVPQRTVLPNRIAIVDNYLPRQCGIATFTTDLCDALHSEYGATELLALPVNDTEEGYAYPARVRFELSEDNLASYRQAADFLNFSGIDLVCLQHEYGIFGGPAGAHILELLRRLRMPFATTLHTVLREPNPDQRRVMEEIATLSDRLIVMSQQSADILQEVFRVPAEKIDLIPHGIPDLPFTDPSFYKDGFGTEGKEVLLTFGLLSPNKGIENVIKALPQILAHHSNVVYMVSGVTHPHILRRDGDKYRHSLLSLAKELGVDANVIFRNRFVSPQEMVELIGAADIYITPYKHKDQVVSGTLAYALSAGKAIISTPYLHAVELLGDERGALVPFNDPAAIAEKTVDLLDNGTARHAMRKRAYLSARDMVWNRVAQKYMRRALNAFTTSVCEVRAPLFQPSTRKRHWTAFRLSSWIICGRMTDHTGMVEHAVFVVPKSIPRDIQRMQHNARALIVTTLLEEIGVHAPANSADLASRYLAFLWHAFDPTTKRFRNFAELRRHMARDRTLRRQPWPGSVGLRNCSGPDPRTPDCGERRGA